MVDRSENVLHERWTEYERLRKAGAIYSSLVRLGEIDSFLRHGKLASGLVEKWRSIMDAVELPDRIVQEGLAQAQKNVLRLKQMLSVGGKFMYEELVLVVTIRIELELFSNFLRHRNLAISFDPCLMDKELNRLAASKENAAGFRNAQTAARKNWGIPIVSGWL